MSGLVPGALVQEVLVVELLGGLGDVLLALPAVHALARAHPDAAMRVLTFRPGDELLTGDPAVTEVVAVADHTEGAPAAAVAAQLARRRPDLAVTTTRYGGIPDLLVAGARRAVTDLWRRPPADEPVDRRYLRVLAAEQVIDSDDVDLPLRVHLTPDEREAGRARLHALLDGLPPVDRLPACGRAASGSLVGQSLRGSPAGRPVLLLPEAGMAIKRWPDARWRELADRLAAAGHPVLAVRGPEARVQPTAGAPTGAGAPTAAALETGSEPPTGPVVAVPPGTLRELAGLCGALAEHDGVAVGGDTGPLRLAAAAGLPTVGLFGPTLAARYAPHPHTALQGHPDCPVRRPTAITEQDCWWSGACPFDREGPACLRVLSVDTVLAAVLGKASVQPASPLI